MFFADGEVVKIRPKRDLVALEGDGVCVTENMISHAGELVTIAHTTTYEGRLLYTLVELGCSWRGAWLQPASVIKLGGE